MTLKTLITMLFFVGSLMVVSVLDADAARRFGGGKSFGSKPSMQRSTTAPKQQNPAVTQGAPSAAAQATKPGLLGGMGGMFGGLLAGTLLGSLLFGGPFNGGGMMDLLLIAVLLFFAFKLFSRMRGGQRASATSAAGGGGGAPSQGPMQYQQQAGEQNNHAWGNLQQGEAAFSPPKGPPVPEGFDIDDFLKGAKLAFNRLQDSWDKRDLDDIALFTSTSVQEEVKKQIDEDPNPGKTEILLSNAQLLSVIEENDEQRATVFFDVLMREDSNPETVQVREVWHFVRPVSGGSWKLDGIQQVEA